MEAVDWCCEEFGTLICFLKKNLFVMDIVDQSIKSVNKDDASFGDAVIDSLFTPGLNNRMKFLMNASYSLLVLTLIGLVILTGGNWHVISLLGISFYSHHVHAYILVLCCALFGAINWFLLKIKSLELAEEKIKAA